MIEKTFGIGDTSKMTGISKSQLRNWEGKFIPEPYRTVCGIGLTGDIRNRKST